MDDFLQHGLVLGSGVHEDSVAHVDEALSFANIAGESSYEVVEVGLKQQQSALFVAASSPNRLPHKHSVGSAIQQPKHFL